MYYSTYYLSPVGKYLLVADNDALIGVFLENQKYYCDCIDEAIIEKENEVLKQTKLWLDRYFDGQKPSIDELKLKPIGSEFRQEVWKILCEIPYGSYITYNDIAKKIAKQRGIQRMSAQAIGGAVGHNPISIIIPCHRVIAANGSLTGYAGGITTKLKLLELEGVDTSKLKIPTKGTAL